MLVLMRCMCRDQTYEGVCTGYSLAPWVELEEMDTTLIHTTLHRYGYGRKTYGSNGLSRWAPGLGLTLNPRWDKSGMGTNGVQTLICRSRLVWSVAVLIHWDQ